MGPSGPRLVERVFPASPFPNSRLSGADTGDAENIRRIYDLPTWKEGFRSERLLVPLTDFFEPAYWGSEKGAIMRFHVPEDEVFFIAAIAIKPNVPKTGKRDGFSLITHAATTQMLNYHHRLVVILRGKDALGFLEPGTPEEKFNYLLEHRYTGPLEAEKERTMAKGWEKRVELHNSKLAHEMKYTDKLAKEGVEG
jgi:putative SOS response-associated peptidase YedK